MRKWTISQTPASRCINPPFLQIKQSGNRKKIILTWLRPAWTRSKFLPLFTHTHTHTRSHEEGKKDSVVCSSLRVEAQHFHWKREEMEKERGEWGKETRRKREGARETRERKGGEKNFTFSPEDAHVWLSSIIPSREDRWRAFQGASPLCYTAKKKRWKEKNVIRRGVTRQSLPRFVSWSGCKTSVVNLP